MNKFVVFLVISTIILSGLGGFLFYQLNDIQTQLIDLQISNNDLQNEVNGLLSENNELEEEISELKKLNNEYYYRIKELEEQLTEWVKITDFRTSGFNPIGGLAIRSDAVVTIQNFGTENVFGLVLTLKSSTCSFGTNVRVERISVGEVKTISTYLEWCLTNSGEVTTTLTLRKGNTILDEVIL